MLHKLSFARPVDCHNLTHQMLTIALLVLFPISNVVFAQSQFSEKAIAQIQSCDSSQINGFATLKERATAEGVKKIDVYMQVNGLSPGNHAVHIHETASCTPCGSAGGHFDPGNFGMTNPDANHPYHSGDLININSDGTQGVMVTDTTRVTLSEGPLSLFDLDGSAFIVHVNPDTYCPGGEAAGCAGGSRAACGIIKMVDTVDDFELAVSAQADRSSPIELANAQLRKKASVFLSPLDPSNLPRNVTFYLNGNSVRTDFRTPFDFVGAYSNGLSAPYNTTKLTDGTHTMAAEIKTTANQTTYVSSVFTVSNNLNSFGNGSDPFNQKYRYIRLMKSGRGNNPGGNRLSLAEVEVIDSAGVNRALAGTATQSSTYDNTTPANRCNDGLRLPGTYPDAICLTQDTSTNEWWQVDLGASYALNSVRIINRKETGEVRTRLSYVYILASDTPFAANTDLAAARANADFEHQLGFITSSNPDRNISIQ